MAKMKRVSDYPISVDEYLTVQKEIKADKSFKPPNGYHIISDS